MKRARQDAALDSPPKPAAKRVARSPSDPLTPTSLANPKMSENGSDYYDSDEEMDAYNSDDGEDIDIDNEDVDDALFNPSNSLKKTRPWEVEYDSLEPEKLREAMARDVEHVVGIFGIDSDTATMLLRSNKWNKERLIDQYMDAPERVLAKAGLPSTAIPSSSRPPVKTKSKVSPPNTQPKPARTFSCPICASTQPSSSAKALSCEHTFCSECWEMYITSKIKDEGESDIKCMEEACSMRVHDGWIESLVDKQTWERFDELLLRAYVADNRSMRFCPHPGCQMTVTTPNFTPTPSALTSTVPTVKDTQGHTFCFGCGEAFDHRPLICAVTKMWLRKCADDSETANWIKSNTKECPKCVSTIEKNGGCNHMTCKKCKNEFCWVCMGPWSEHGTAWYNCNRFDEKGGIDARDAQSKSRASLERYLHYYNRFANHEQSARLDQELYSKTEKKMEEMQLASSLTWIEVQFARRAVDELVRCRMTLKWTYAMAYYLKKDNETEMFEDNQRDLERAVEDLSEMLESPIEPGTISDLRAKMTNKTVYVQKRNEIMLEDTAQKYQEGKWRWNDMVPDF